MPRYIDADLEVSKYVTVWDCDCSEFGKQTVMAVDDLHYLPTADIAPRAEVAREIFWEIDKLLARIITDDEAGTQFIGVDMQKYYALKMKYTATTDEPPKGE